ncbi:CheR family methyltransferase [Burkholderiaceae bacterium UC74_6]
MSQDDLTLRRVQRLRDCVMQRLGLKMSERHQPLLVRWLDERASEGELDACLDRLEQRVDASDLFALADELAVGEGWFFRHAGQFERLPALLASIGHGGPLRVLSAGCGSGEEAWSLAMSLAELRPGSRIEAFDLCPNRVQHAETGRYGDWSMRVTPGSMRRHWFRREDGFYEILPELRGGVDFSARNLSERDTGFWSEPRFDLVLCRNVLSYLEPAAVEAALNHLAQVLKPGGWLWLGRGEQLRGRDDLFKPHLLDGWTFYERTPSARDPQRSRLRPGPGSLWLRQGRDTIFELWRQGRLRQALHLADSVLAQDRSDCELLLAQVMLQLQAGHVPEAQRIGMRLLSLATTPAMGAAARYAKARGHELRNESVQALENYQQAARLDPGFALAQLRLGQLLREQGDGEAGAEALRRASELMAFEDERRILVFGEGLGRRELAALCELEAVPA